MFKDCAYVFLIETAYYRPKNIKTNCNEWESGVKAVTNLNLEITKISTLLTKQAILS